MCGGGNLGVSIIVSYYVIVTHLCVLVCSEPVPGYLAHPDFTHLTIASAVQPFPTQSSGESRQVTPLFDVPAPSVCDLHH